MGKIYTNEKQIILQEMLEVYSPEEFDWMSYQITINNFLTFHHILEQSKGGLTTLNNGALLTKRAHRILNMLPSRDKGLYTDWNQFFKEIVQKGQPLDAEQKQYSRSLKKYTQKIMYK